MRKTMAFIVLIIGALLIAAPSYGDNDPPHYPPERGEHLKVDVCHWANGHPHVVHVSINAVAFPQDTGHGFLVLNSDDGTVIAFLPHAFPPGHSQDDWVQVYVKKGNQKLVTDVNEDVNCGEEETTTTTVEETTTTTVPEETTTTTVPEETTTTTVSNETTTTTETSVTSTTVPTSPVVVASVESAPAPAPSSLPNTGGATLPLLLLGSGSTGLGLLLRKLARK